ncbi:MAG: hypothetical protein IKI72_00605, partial [Bacteroidales bacterium]|nr:hypothetical protein [Bacteroidales bacterium]
AGAGAGAVGADAAGMTAAEVAAAGVVAADVALPPWAQAGSTWQRTAHIRLAPAMRKIRREMFMAVS